jgi:hypothetical protein
MSLDKLTLDQLTDDQLSTELHRRRKANRDLLDQEYQKFASQVIAVLEAFEKLTGKRIVRSGYGYRVEEKP